MDDFEFSLLGAAIASVSALAAEVIRIKQAVDRLAADMRERELQGGDPLVARQVRYPRGYFVTAVLYAVVAGVAGGAAGPGIPWVVDVYIGFSLPAFVARLVQTAEPHLPGRVTLGGTGDERPEHATVDSVGGETRGVYRRVRPGVVRSTTSLYSYLVA